MGDAVFRTPMGARMSLRAAAEDLAALAWLHEAERDVETLNRLHAAGFPEGLSLADPAAPPRVAMGEALLRFDKEAEAWLVKLYKVGKAYVAIYRDYQLKNAIRVGDAAKVAREIAETRLEIGERGRRWVDGETTGWAAGWQDFEEYRTNGNMP